MRRRGFLALLGSAALAPFVPVPIAELPPPSTWVSVEQALREFYSETTVLNLVYAEHPFFSMIQKSERFT